MVSVVVPLGLIVGVGVALALGLLGTSAALVRTRAEGRAAARAARARMAGISSERDELARRTGVAETSLAELRGRLAAAQSALVSVGERQRLAEERAGEAEERAGAAEERAGEAEGRAGA
ncbi:MAG: hypothetical protein ACRDYD_00320, partial [Acidimicrobiales bacterium]